MFGSCVGSTECYMESYMGVGLFRWEQRLYYYCEDDEDDEERESRWGSMPTTSDSEKHSVICVATYYNFLCVCVSCLFENRPRFSNFLHDSNDDGADVKRSEERRVGKEWVRTGRSRW